MNTTEQVWVYEGENEEGESFSPSFYSPMKCDVFSPDEFIAFDTVDNIIYWHKGNTMLAMSKEYARINYPRIFKQYKKYKYD